MHLYGKPCSNFVRKISFDCVRTVAKGISKSVCLVHSTTKKLIHNPVIMENGTHDKCDKDTTFKFTDYDCIGFDLDNAVARYKVGAMLDLTYEVLANYLVDQKNYSRTNLLKPVELDFFIKGLIIDDTNGNILKIKADGTILQASHGTNMLDEQSILEYYPDQHWEVTDKFVENPMETWNGPYAAQMRTLLDYFDMSVSLIFARAVDSVDEAQGKQKSYNVWPDILDGLIYMYSRDHFKTGHGGFFTAIKENPSDYYYKCSDNLIKWFKALKRNGRLLCLITGSHADFASFTAENTIGPEWRDIFDVVVCFAKKPGFFTMKRDFIGLNGDQETGPIDSKDLESGGVYTHGNWKDLCSFLTSKSKKADPRCLYIGDNLIQDIYTPNLYGGCDTVAVCEELQAEGKYACIQQHPYEQYLVSQMWGSYFKSKTNEDTYWLHLLNNYSKLSVPNLEFVANLPLEYKYRKNDID